MEYCLMPKHSTIPELHSLLAPLRMPLCLPKRSNSPTELGHGDLGGAGGTEGYPWYV